MGKGINQQSTKVVHTFNRAGMRMQQPEMIASQFGSMGELQNVMAAEASVVKLTVGVANNSSYIVMADAWRQVQSLPLYRHKVKAAFRKAMDEWHEYEHRLLYARQNRFFHVNDMTEAVRKKYGDISDRDYYDYWCGCGVEGYNKTKPMIDSLCYKYRKSLERHNVPGAKAIAAALTAMACLKTSVTILDVILERVHQHTGIIVPQLMTIFGSFSLAPVRDAWERALRLMIPDVMEFDLDEDDSRNIELGLEQLAFAWTDVDMQLSAVVSGTESYEDVFRTKGEWKKAMREIAELRG